MLWHVETEQRAKKLPGAKLRQAGAATTIG